MASLGCCYARAGATEVAPLWLLLQLVVVFYRGGKEIRKKRQRAKNRLTEKGFFLLLGRTTVHCALVHSIAWSTWRFVVPFLPTAWPGSPQKGASAMALPGAVFCWTKHNRRHTKQAKDTKPWITERGMNKKKQRVTAHKEPDQKTIIR
nr:hypothetical protein [Pandoravirus massiliensis]